ncbi:MAG: virulence RhuM family protein, partial [Bacteroidia bacterium]
MQEIVIYQNKDKNAQVEVRLEADTVWLSQAQMAELFQRDQSVISRHINNIFKEVELEKESNMHFLHIANSDKQVAFFSLDVIISVGYRVKSKQGTQFRIWATKLLKEHLVKG